MIALAFARLDRNGDNKVTLAEIESIYDASRHPDVVSGKRTTREVLTAFMQQWDKIHPDSVISKEEFVEYYKDVSASIDDDRYFELMIRNAWHITGGEGQAENTANLRVLVTFEDGSQDIVTVEDDLGVRRDDFPLIRKRLFMQGVRGVVNISLSD